MITQKIDNERKRTCKEYSFGTCKETIAGLPQGSILEPFFFTIVLNDIFYLENNLFK